MIDNETAGVVRRVRRETKVTIPSYLLSDELRELHERIQTRRSELRELERDFQGLLREHFNMR